VELICYDVDVQGESIASESARRLDGSST